MPEERLTISSSSPCAPRRGRPPHLRHHSGGASTPPRSGPSSSTWPASWSAASDREQDLRRALAEAETPGRQPRARRGHADRRARARDGPGAALGPRGRRRAGGEGRERRGPAASPGPGRGRGSSSATPSRTPTTARPKPTPRPPSSVRRAQDEASARVEGAKLEAEALVTQTRAECRAMVQEAQELRARVLADLTRRRRVLHSQIEQLRAGRERLAETIGDVRHAVDQHHRRALPGRGRSPAGGRGRRAPGGARRSWPSCPTPERVADDGGSPSELRRRRGIRARHPPVRGGAVRPTPGRGRCPDPRLAPSPRTGAATHLRRPARPRPRGRARRRAGRTGRVAASGGLRRRRSRASGSSPPRLPPRPTAPPKPTTPAKPLGVVQDQEGGRTSAEVRAGPGRARRPTPEARRSTWRPRSRSRRTRSVRIVDPVVAAARRGARPARGRPGPPAQAGPPGRPERHPRPLPGQGRLGPRGAALRGRARPALRARPPPTSCWRRPGPGPPSPAARPTRRPASTTWPPRWPRRSWLRCAGASRGRARRWTKVTSRPWSSSSAPPSANGRARAPSVWPETRRSSPSPEPRWRPCPRAPMLRWVVDDDVAECPDCDDNALAGPVPSREAFPTGHPHPPAHAGCRCLLVPANA